MSAIRATTGFATSARVNTATRRAPSSHRALSSRDQGAFSPAVSGRAISARVVPSVHRRGRPLAMKVSAALPPAAAGPVVGCLFETLPFGAFIARVLGGAITSIASRLWSKRHLSDATVTHADTPAHRALMDACPHFSKPYDAVDALRNRHACTIVASLLRENPPIEYQREVLRMPDGGHVTLDWPIHVPPYPGQPEDVQGTMDALGAVMTTDGQAREVTSERAAKDRTDDIIRQLQYGPAKGSASSSSQSTGDSATSPDGVPGVIGLAGGGGTGGCGSGGNGCDVDFDTLTPPFRRSIPDQGRTVLRKRLAKHWRKLPDDAPVLILMSGIAGGSHDKYLKHFMRRASRAGYRCVAFNCRGTANSPLTTPQFYSASFTGDVRNVVDEVKGRWPNAHLFAVGWSLGANILTNFLGEEGDDAKLTGAVAMCNPFDLNACDVALQDGFFGTVYSRAMAKNMRALFAPHEHLFQGLPNYDNELVGNAKTVRDFDEAVTRVTFGFPSVDAYYDASSSRLKIGDVRVPLLVVQAKDDPIAVHSAVPRDVIKGKTTKGPVVLVETESGGHLGWTAGAEAPFGSPWPDVGAMQFFEACRRGVGRMSSGDVDDAAPVEAGVSAEVGAAEVAVEAPAAR